MFIYDSLLKRFTDYSQKILKDNLIGIYLHGSAVMGCFNSSKSDLDLIVVTATQMTDAIKREYMEMVVELDEDAPAKGLEMSVVSRLSCNHFIYPTPFELHYSRMHTEWYRNDPEDYIRKMKGSDKDLAAHFTIIRHRGKCLHGIPIDNVFGKVPRQAYIDSIWYDICNAAEEITENTMYYILNMARVMAYLKDDAVMSKKEGGEWGLKNLPSEYHPLLRSALQEYADGIDGKYDQEIARQYTEYMLNHIKEYIV